MPATLSQNETRPPQRLQRAQQHGFLNARCRDSEGLIRNYGLWCWRMGVPMVWYERRSAGSRFTRVHLEMLTTPFVLSVRGHAALIAVSAPVVQARHATIMGHGALWEMVPSHAADDFARSVFRAVRGPGSYEATPKPVDIPVGGNLLRFKPKLALRA